MSPLAILVLALSMSADAFAAAISRGASHRPALPQAIRAGLVFGVIEAITPLLGWFAGSVAADYVQEIDHWIAFVLLVLVGGHMIRQARGAAPEQPDLKQGGPKQGGLLALVATAIGTSIDAAAIGVSLAFLDVNIWVVASAIGLSTFLLTTIGMLVGSVVGVKLGRRAETAGGIALVAIGFLILVDHLWLGG